MRYRYIAVLLVLLMVVSAVLPVSAAETVEVFVTLTGEPLADAAYAVGGAAEYAASPEGAAAIAEAQARLAAMAAQIARLPGAEVLGQSWFLSLSLGVRLPIGQVETLAALTGVARVEVISAHAAPTAAELDGGTSAESTDDKSAAVYAPDLLGLDAVHGEGVLGEGVLAAVIDSGFDLEHPVFTLPDTVEPTMTLETMGTLFPLLSLTVQPTDVWVSGKVPFAYDYSGNDTDVLTADVHGTHVASILGGGADADGEYVGVAPGVQLLLMKVFTDGTTPSASDYAVYRAVEDAMLLGADIISLSLGTAAGYPYATNTFSLYRHLEKARELGCVVVCSAGNDGAVGSGSAYDEAYEIDLPLAANPDYGLIADPASYASTLAVGAYTPDRTVQSGLGAGDGTLFSFNDSAAGQGFAMEFTTVLADRTLEYAVVPGVGRAEDYAGLDLVGKLALVCRGEISFTEKLLAAAEAGAVGMICYNNEAADELISMAFDEMPIPAVFVTKADGERLADAAPHARSVTVSSSLLRVVESDNAGRPAAYSARGSGLMIRPSLLSPGTIYAALPGGGYGTQGGTSMATPAVAGLAALALGERDEAARDAWDTAALDDLLADLITTASPILDEDGHSYSVRVQGGGAVQAEVFLAAKGALRAEDGRGVIELGDGLDPAAGFSFTVTLNNRTKRSRTYAISASVGSDDYLLLEEAGGVTAFADEHMRVFADAELLLDGVDINRYSLYGSPMSLTLAPGETKTLTVTVALSADALAEYRTYFPNGFYLEGYLFAEAADGETLSLPYLGYAGDFDALPYLDSFGYDGGSSFFVQNYLFGYAGETALNLGCSYYDENAVFRSDLLAISPNGDGYLDEAFVNLYLLRNLYSFEIEVTDASGAFVMNSKRAYYLTKTFLNSETGLQDVLKTDVWGGEDEENVAYIMPDGRYTVTFRVFARGDEVVEEVSLPLVIDTAAPEVTDTVIEEVDGRRKLTVTLRDDHYPMRAVLYRNATDEYGRTVELYRDAHNISYKEGRREIRLTYDITEFEGDYLYLDLYDYAMNQTTCRIALDGASDPAA